MRPKIPILLVENINYPQGRFDMNTRSVIDSINLVFKQAYTSLKNDGFSDLYYLPAKNLIGNDGEATVDGTHLTDVGFMRIAEQIEKQLKLILHLK